MWQKTIDKMIKKVKDNSSLIIIVAVIVLAAIGITAYLTNNSASGGIKVVSADVAGQKAIDYINANYLSSNTDGEKVSLKEVVKTNSLYKVKFSYKGQDNEGYVTLDGKLLFPAGSGSPINMDEKAETTNGETKKTCEEVKKADKSVLDAFVVSQCPYGLQMQRVLAEVVKNIPSMKDSIKVRYIGSVSNGKITSMHGDAEATENLRQICFREETSQYWDYVSCYMKKEGASDSCLTSIGADKNKISACMSDQSRGLKYAQEDFNLANSHNVQGSPTLVLNQESADESWFGGRTAEALKTLVCCGFTTKPDFCSQPLSQDSAAASFSETYKDSSGSSQGGDCAQ